MARFRARAMKIFSLERGSHLEESAVDCIQRRRRVPPPRGIIPLFPYSSIPVYWNSKDLPVSRTEASPRNSIFFIPFPPVLSCIFCLVSPAGAEHAINWNASPKHFCSSLLSTYVKYRVGKFLTEISFVRNCKLKDWNVTFSRLN